MNPEAAIDFIAFLGAAGICLVMLGVVAWGRR